MQDGFVVRIFATSTEPVLQQELQLKLARKCLHACGISLFDLEKDLHIISKFSSLKVNNKSGNSNNRGETLPFPLALWCAEGYSSMINTWRGVWNCFKHYLTQSQIHTPILNHLSVSSTTHGFLVFSFTYIINI